MVWVDMEILNAILGDVNFFIKTRRSKRSLLIRNKANFRIDDSEVVLTLPEGRQPEAIVLDKGDHVLLAGKFKKGKFKALAYKNITKGVSSKKPPILDSLFGGVAMTGMGIFVLYAAYSEFYIKDVSDDGLNVLVLIGLAFISVSLLILWEPVRRLKAYKLLDEFSGM